MNTGAINAREEHKLLHELEKDAQRLREGVGPSLDGMEGMTQVKPRPHTHTPTHIHTHTHTHPNLMPTATQPRHSQSMPTLTLASVPQGPIAISDVKTFMDLFKMNHDAMVKRVDESNNYSAPPPS